MGKKELVNDEPYLDGYYVAISMEVIDEAAIDAMSDSGDAEDLRERLYLQQHLLDTLQTPLYDTRYAVFPNEPPIPIDGSQTTASETSLSQSDSEVAEELANLDPATLEGAEKIGSLELHRQISSDGTTAYILLKAPDKVLRYFAEQAGISCLQMYDIRGVRKEEPEHKCCWRVKACCSAAGADSHIDRDYNLFSLKHYKRFIKNEETGELFNSAEKIRIIDYLLETTRANGGLYLNLEEYREEGIIKDYFMLNDLETLHTLKRDWIWKLAPQPLDRIRDYYGSRISQYFAFLGFYTQWLFFLAVPGTAVQFSLWYWKYDNMLVAVYALLAMLWATALLEFQKRNANTLAQRWNVMNLEDIEVTRPEYRGDLMVGAYRRNTFVDLADLNELFEEHYPRAGQNLRKAQTLRYNDQSYCSRACEHMVSIAVVLLFVVLIISISGALLLLRVFLTNEYGTYGGVLGGVLISANIAIFNQVYTRAARLITDWENHRTESAYFRALVLKVFVFQFCNSYISLFYIAFLKGTNSPLQFFSISESLKDGCLLDTDPALVNDTMASDIASGYSDSQPAVENCVKDLGIQLFSLLVTSQVIGQLKELTVPYFMHKWKVRTQKKKARAFLAAKAGDEEEAKAGPVASVSADASVSVNASPDASTNASTNTSANASADASADTSADASAGGSGVSSSSVPSSSSDSSSSSSGAASEQQEEEAIDEEINTDILISRVEVEATLVSPKFDYTFDQYNELLIQFGFVILFAPAFPLAALAAVVNNMIELKTDAWILTTHVRRQQPHPAKGIGAWLSVLRVMGAIAVVSNSGLLAFTSRTFEREFDWDLQTKILVAVFLEHLIFGLKYVLSMVIPDMAASVRGRVAREEFLSGGRDHPKYWRNLYSRRSKKATATGAGGNPDPKQM